jgi:hypothetical protein
MSARGVACTLVLALSLPSVLLAAPNTDARIVLHAQTFGAQNNCSTPQALGLDCEGVRPTVSVSPGQDVEVYVYLHSYDSAAGAQMAFTWHSSWTFMYWTGACHELLGEGTPQASGDSYIGAFDAITGGQLQPLGRIRFIAGNAGTQFSIAETWAPGGTGMVDGQLAFSTIPSAHRGVIAVGGPGIDSCGGKSESSALYEGE